MTLTSIQIELQHDPEYKRKSYSGITTHISVNQQD
jgi:hypothetical protein